MDNLGSWDDVPCCELNTDENTIDCERCGLCCEACHPRVERKAS